MRIQEVRVHRYGPLSDFALTDLGDFTLLFGENESGKTLLLDAILRFLLRRKRDQALFPHLNRVEHEPEGFIDIVRGERTFRFPSDQSLPDVLGIHAEDLRNILVVRAGDLQVQPGQQKDYYAELTDRLMGIHREPMKKIMAKLREIGRLTQGGAISDSQENEKIASRLEHAKHQLSRITKLRQEVAETDLVALEARLLDAMERRDRLVEELHQLREAEKREAYETGNRLLGDLEECMARMDDLPAIEQKDYDEWRDAEKEIEDASTALEQAEEELSGLKRSLEAAEAELQAAEERVDELQRKQPEIERVRDDARRHRVRLQADAWWSPFVEAAPRVILFSGILFALALMAAAARPESAFFNLASRLIGAALAIAALVWLVRRAIQGRRRSEWETLRLEAAQHGLRAEDLEGLLEALEAFLADLERAKNAATKAQTNYEVGVSQVATQRARIEEHEQKRDQAKQKLAGFKETLGLATWHELESKMEELDKLKRRRDELITELRTRFGGEGEPFQEMLALWRSEVDELAGYEKAAEGIEYDKTRMAKLDGELSDLRTEIAELEDQLDQIRSKIAEIAAEANRILRRDELLPGDTLEDLRVIEEELTGFVQHVEQRARLAGKAMEILEEIQTEEEQKVKGLFGEDDLASQHFRWITAGAYDRVDYDPDDGELKVIRADGESLGAYVLSSGTYDQLYLATRLSLSHRLLQGEPGFLLLDDPFLTSDRDRLLRQLDILRNLAGEGWQIVYFSVKDEVRTGLSDSIENDRVNLVPLASLVEAGELPNDE